MTKQIVVTEKQERAMAQLEAEVSVQESIQSGDRVQAQMAEPEMPINIGLPSLDFTEDLTSTSESVDLPPVSGPGYLSGLV